MLQQVIKKNRNSQFTIRNSQFAIRNSQFAKTKTKTKKNYIKNYIDLKYIFCFEV